MTESDGNFEPNPEATDFVDGILEQWRAVAPGLMLSDMATLGRLMRTQVLVVRQLEARYARHGLTMWMFDVLATLKRNGPPFRLSPTALYSSLLVTSGTMTHRLKKLDGEGWIRRVDDPDDARSMLVELTEAGHTLIDRLVVEHLEEEARLLAGLGDAERRALDEGLKALSLNLEHISQTGADEAGR